MKHLIIILLLVLGISSSSAQSKVFIAEENNNTITSIDTKYKYSISNVEYTIFCTPKGSLFIEKISKKGNKYNYYLTNKLSTEQKESIYSDLINTLPDNIYESISLKYDDNTSYEILYKEYLKNKDKYNTLASNEVNSTL